MAKSNRDRVGSALDKFVEGMVPYVQRELDAKYPEGWDPKVRDYMRNNPAMASKADNANIAWDATLVIQIINSEWQYLFRYKLDKAHRSMLLELGEARNSWAHQQAFTADDAIRALDTIYRLLSAVSAGDEAAAVDRLKQELWRVRFGEMARTEEKKASKLALAGQPQGGLRPWREVVTPHRDVASGKFAQAEFAADLAQVLRGDAPDEYGEPTEFFRRTYITDGLRGLLTGAIERLLKKGGDPVIELQTNFGGGKTHSMLALYHLVSGVPGATLPGVDAIMAAMEVTEIPKANRAVLVGTALSAGQAHKKPDGTVVHTLWGEMAWQLLGKKGYKILAECDKNATNPGSDLLTELFKAASPCLILIDEWVAYIRQTYNTPDLPGGTFDSNLSFAQSLTEAVKAVPDALVVASLPQSRIEVGGEGGQQALDILQNTFTRVKSSWRPASQEESYEIVRRRLFDSINADMYPARDAVVKAFSDLYRSNEGEFPSGCKEHDYFRQLELAYPIHPELFERLYTDWSSLDEFQRTRGVLRLMAATIHSLWEDNDKSLMIMPAMIPMDDQVVQGELTTKSGLSPAWSSVIEKDIDGPAALPRQLDGDNPNLGRLSACRRVARTIYMGSAPTTETAKKGIDDRRVKLGCVQPGESVPIFGDAIRRLTDAATHLYVDGSRYWFSTQPSVSRLAQDRAAQQKDDDLLAELIDRLRKQQKHKGDFAGVHAVPPSSADIPDIPEVRLVILSPDQSHASKSDDSKALLSAREMLQSRGNSPRINRNTLVFLAADTTRLGDVKQAIRAYRAWKSIYDERESLNLDSFQTNQAKTKMADSNESIDARIPEAYHWLLVPTQPDPTDSVQWQQFRLQGDDVLSVRAAKRLTGEELLITEYSGVRLKMDLDRVPLWREDGAHVAVKQLCEDVAQYLYLPRFRDETVVLDAIADGISKMGTWEEETFAYAQGFDKDRNRYLGLVAGQATVVRKDNESLVVHPKAAAAQLKADAAVIPPKTGGEGGGGTTVDISPRGPDGEGGGDPTVGPTARKQPTRFYGTVSLSSTRMGRDASRIADEIIAHLSGLPGVSAEITLDIEFTVPDGIPDNVVRTVSENCKTLKFDSQGFEAE